MIDKLPILKNDTNNSESSVRLPKLQRSNTTAGLSSAKSKHKILPSINENITTSKNNSDSDIAASSSKKEVSFFLIYVIEKRYVREPKFSCF